MKHTNIDKYCYILFNPQSLMVFYGFNESDMFGNDMGLSYHTTLLSTARQVKRQVLKELGVDCKILKYSVLEVE